MRLPRSLNELVRNTRERLLGALVATALGALVVLGLKMVGVW